MDTRRIVANFCRHSLIFLGEDRFECASCAQCALCWILSFSKTMRDTLYLRVRHSRTLTHPNVLFLSSYRIAFTPFLCMKVKRPVAITGPTFKTPNSSDGANSTTSLLARSRGTKFPVSRWEVIVTWAPIVSCTLTLAAKAVSAPAVQFRSCQRIYRSLLIRTMLCLKVSWETGTKSSWIKWQVIKVVIWFYCYESFVFQ